MGIFGWSKSKPTKVNFRDHVMRWHDTSRGGFGIRKHVETLRDRRDFIYEVEREFGSTSPSLAYLDKKLKTLTYEKKLLERSGHRDMYERSVLEDKIAILESYKNNIT